MRAEDQALVASIRAVPRAERHRLREIPTEEAYGEWKLRVALEQAKAAGGQYEELEKQAGALLCQWQSSEGFWKGEDWENQKKYEDLRRKAGEAWRQWHECCLAWGDICQETSC